MVGVYCNEVTVIWAAFFAFFFFIFPLQMKKKKRWNKTTVRKHRYSCTSYVCSQGGGLQYMYIYFWWNIQLQEMNFWVKPNFSVAPLWTVLTIYLDFVIFCNDWGFLYIHTWYREGNTQYTQCSVCIHLFRQRHTLSVRGNPISPYIAQFTGFSRCHVPGYFPSCPALPPRTITWACPRPHM